MTRFRLWTDEAWRRWPKPSWAVYFVFVAVVFAGLSAAIGQFFHDQQKPSWFYLARGVFFAVLYCGAMYFIRRDMEPRNESQAEGGDSGATQEAQ